MTNWQLILMGTGDLASARVLLGGWIEGLRRDGHTINLAQFAGGAATVELCARDTPPYPPATPGDPPTTTPAGGVETAGE